MYTKYVEQWQSNLQSEKASSGKGDKTVLKRTFIVQFQCHFRKGVLLSNVDVV